MAATRISKQEILHHITSILKKGGKVIGIGSPRASLEANFALRKMVGPEQFHLGMNPGESGLVAKAVEILRKDPAKIASISDIEKADAVLVLGEDLTNTAPRLALAVRQSVRQKPMETPKKFRIPAWHDYAVRTLIQDEKGPLIIASPFETRLDEIASDTYRAAPEDIARLGHAVANALQPDAPPAGDLSDKEKDLANRIAQQLKDARRPAVISGTGCGSLALLEAAANVVTALSKSRADKENVRLCMAVPECNSIGLSMLGGATLDAAFEKARQGVDAILILENDLYRRAPSQGVNGLFGTGTRTVLIDSLENETAAKADIILPASTFAESEGTLVNNEGRAQRFFKVMTPVEDVQESWRWLRDIMIAAGQLEESSWSNLDAVIAALQSELPQFRQVQEAAPPASFRIVNQKIPRQLHRYSGRTAMMANVTVHEPAPPPDPDSALAFSMEGYQGQPPAGLASFFWAPGWNSYQAVNRYQNPVGGPLRGGPAGVRLLQGDGSAEISYFGAVPKPFRKREGEFLILPARRIFGSEELSIHAPGIAEVSAKPCVEINHSDAEKLGISDGQQLEVSVGAVNRKLPAKLNHSLPPGVAALPAGLPELAGIILPAWAKLSVIR